MAADALCLENIDEYVNDENKIVTCKWLSLTLKIHINQAKRLLYTFLHKQKQQKNQQVNATYFVAGLSQNSHGILEHKCLVVPEEDLEATRRQLSVVTSCHIYSVQRAQVKDPNVLYLADYDGMKENQSDINRYSSILCKQVAVSRSRSSVASKVPEKKNDSHQESKSNKTEEMKQNNTDSVALKNKKVEPKGRIASMFAQSAKKSSTEDLKKKEESSMKPQKEENKTDKAPPKKGSVMDLFANAKPLVKPKAAETKKFPAVAETKAPNKDRISSTQSTKRNVKKAVRIRDDSDDEEPERKRRRRIRYDMSESSSEDEIEVPESPLPSPAKEPSPQPESPTPEKKEQAEMYNNRQATTPPREQHTNGNKMRRRRRKLVPKTSLDEDGFMVTENVWESESTDASEMEDEAKKPKTVQKPNSPPPKTSPRKKPSPVKGKQTSLMSFFKKK